MSTGLLLVFIATIFWAVGDFLSQRTVKKIGDYESLLWINFIAVIFLFPLVINDIHLLKNWSNLAPLLLLSVIDLAYSLLLYRAYETGKLSVIEVIMTAELPSTIILGIIFFHERLRFIEIVLIITILCGVLMISRKKEGFMGLVNKKIFNKKFIFEKGAILAFAAAIICGFYNFMVATNARIISAPMTIWFTWLMAILPLFILMRINKTNFNVFLNKSHGTWKLILATGLTQTIAWLAFAYSLKTEELSISTAITESYPAIAVFLAIRYNHEKISRLQVIGALMTLLAAIVLGLIAG